MKHDMDASEVNSVFVCFRMACLEAEVSMRC